jgi:two-component system, LytTR family, response regulator
MQINCIIVEDEPLAQERLKNYITQTPYLHLTAIYENSLDALVYIKTNPVELVFLDIQLDGITGIQLLESTNLNCQVIITTAYHEYALKGYELNITDYLLKPFSFERFEQAVEKVQVNLNKKIGEEPTYFFVKTSYKLEKTYYADLLFIEGMRDYRKLYTVSNTLLTLQTFKEFEASLPEKLFCRVHKSYMVAIDKIDTIERDEIKIGVHTIYISETYKQSFFERLKKA